MELKQIGRVFFKAWQPLGVFSAAAFLLGLAITAQIPPIYRATLDLYVKRQTPPPSERFYSFDGFYSQQAAERYTPTVIGFLRNRDILRLAAEKIKQPTDQFSLKKLSQTVKVKEAAPQLATLTVASLRADLAKDLSLALAEAAVQRLKFLNETGDAALAIDLVTATPLVEVEKPSLWLGGLVGFILGASLILLGLSLREYLHDRTA